MPDAFPETYLGDGLYASFDGYHLRLRAPRDDSVDHVVFLEPEVVSSLLGYIAKLPRHPQAA